MAPVALAVVACALRTPGRISLLPSLIHVLAGLSLDRTTAFGLPLGIRVRTVGLPTTTTPFCMAIPPPVPVATPDIRRCPRVSYHSVPHDVGVSLAGCCSGLASIKRGEKYSRLEDFKSEE